MVVNRNQPAKRFPLVQPLFHETYIQAMYRQKYTSDHWRRIDYAKPMIDDGPPQAIINPRLKLKHIQARGDRLARIEKDNKIMLRNILTTMRGPGKVDHYFKVPPQRPNSLNFDNRKFWVRQVNTDNKAMLKRLIQSRSVYDRIEMEKSYQHMIRSGRGRRYVLALWDAQRRFRRHWIMSGKCEHTSSGTVTNMESLRARTAATHRRCFEATDVEPFHHTEIPERCRPPPGAHRVDHKRCFHDPSDKPFVRAAQLCPQIMKRSLAYPIPLTRAHRLRLQANKEWINNFLQELASHEAIQKKVMNTNTNQTDKEENLNQSASCSYSRNCRESSKDSPYRENLHLDKLASMALPPIANSSKTSPTKEEAAAVSESVKESNKLPKLPSSKLSKEVGAFRPCALRVGDTSIIAPCWRPVIPSCHKAAPPQQQQHHHNTASRMSQLGKSLCDVYAKNVKRSTVTSLPSITATVSKVGSKMSRASDSVSSTKTVKLSPLGLRARKNSADTENSQDGTETVWERKTLTTGDSKKFWSDVASEKDRRVSCTMERQHRPEHWDIVESSKTRSTAGRRNSSEPRKNQKGSGDKSKPLSENNLTKRVLEPLRAKGSPRNTSLESLERDRKTRPYFSVKRSLLSDLEYSNEHFSVLPPCSDASFSSRSWKKKGDRRRESELPVLKSDNPHPKTSFRNEDRKDPEPSSRPVPCASNSPRSQPSPTPEEAGSNRHPDLCAECLELGAEQNTSADSELQDSVISDVQDSEISEDETPRKDEQDSSENSLTTDPGSKGGEVANWPSPANDATHSMVTGSNQCRLADLGVLHSRGQQTPTCSTQRGTKLDRLIFSDDSSEECVDGTSLYSDED